MTALGDHAAYELDYQGIVDPDRARIIAIVGNFADYTDPAARAAALQQVQTLLQFKPLSPLTSEPAQWIDQSSLSGERQLWQSKRDPDAWSHDGGATYYMQSQSNAIYQSETVP
ncbi:hypothetical protein L3Q65_46220 [Amycolatopsis sp. FU40]|uniref:hypothetical protein n=1 Tax=Amycolatopsis sp. FU40 TaxID=2914159 RepID=UPI001F347ECC|nr:hypothetical protein [Amycolatopsis sp. FU40]UKD55172.1 hypothetical protein L3Q65_46220 [Amycolatopsis sp. FU40]